MITKKDIPLNLFKAIEVIAQSNLDIIQLKKEENTYYSFIETDVNSNNYFKIYQDGNKRIGNFDSNKYAYELKPREVTTALHGLGQGNLGELIDTFNKWIKIIREIHETPSIQDDNFVKQYSDYYFNEFKIVDEDANTSPFNPTQQDSIDLYLDSLTLAIEKSDDKIEDDVKAELLSEIQEIKITLQISTKNQVMKSITKIFGKLYKVSKPFAIKIVEEAQKVLIKKLIELSIEYAPKILEIFSSHHS
jgi:hypothetical protein